LNLRRIRYECTIAPDPATGALKVFRCNCSYCQKLSTTNLHLNGPEDFRLLRPASRDEVANYPSRTQSTTDRYFCATCGVHVWMQGAFAFHGQTFHRFVVNLGTVDQPQEGLELSQVKIKYWDGLNDNFAAGTRDEPWLGGLV
jgi:hypothetical protein